MDINDAHEAWPIVCASVGQKISAIEEVRNVLRGVIDPELEGLQLTFSSGQILFLYLGTAGQNLRAENSPWKNPFAGKLSPDNLEYLEKYGDWTLIDFSDEALFRELIGRTIQAVYPIRTTNNWLSGARFEVGQTTFNFVVVWDLL